MIATILFWLGALILAAFALMAVVFVLMIVGELVDVLIDPPGQTEQLD